jgi:hypothetical protein
MMKRLLAAGVMIVVSAGVGVGVAGPASATGMDFEGKFPTKAKCETRGKELTDPPHRHMSYGCSYESKEKTSDKWYLYTFPTP